MDSSRKAQNLPIDPGHAATVTPLAPDEAETDQLLRAFQDFKHRQGAPADDPRHQEMLHAVCATLISGPHELGLSVQTAPLDESLRTCLEYDTPEARVCLLWLQCAEGKTGTDTTTQFAKLARENLWEPLQALAFRALAHLGGRQTLATILRSNGPLSTIRADAYLDASLTEDIEAGWPTRPDIETTEEILPASIREHWHTLLAAEASLTQSELNNSVRTTLASLASLADEAIPHTYAAAQTHHIAARAGAALVRALLIHKGGVDTALTDQAASLLPEWEKNYLQALVRWRSSDARGAIELLEVAMKANPLQTPVRLALATLLSASAPEKALDVLTHDEPTREMYVAQATLLARLGCYREAHEALDHCGGPVTAGGEPARFTFASGRAQARQHEQILRAVLAEHEGDWPRAEKFWRASGIRQKSWQAARRLWAAQRELSSPKPMQHWRRAQIKQTWERGLHELSSVPLTGDALFFRSAALTDTEPERACKDLQTLLRQSSWVEAERRSGGARLVFIGDLLWRLGHVEEALRAYELVDKSSPQIAGRRAMAGVWRAVGSEAEAEKISRAADDASALSPSSYWPQLLAAVGLLRIGATDAARARLAHATSLGAAEEICSALDALCAGPATVQLSVEEISSLDLPATVAAVMRYMLVGEPQVERLDALAGALGQHWLELCPTELEPAATQLLAAWCEQDRWAEALECARELMTFDTEWAINLYALVGVRYALTLALRGDLEAADEELSKLEFVLQSRTA